MTREVDMSKTREIPKAAVVQCNSCIHRLLHANCAAFPTPGSIPYEITFGKHDHRKAFPGDQGIRYEAKTEETEEEYERRRRELQRMREESLK